jgi:hypothetical protein
MFMSDDVLLCLFDRLVGQSYTRTVDTDSTTVASSFLHLRASDDEHNAIDNVPIHPKHIAWSPQSYPIAEEQKYCDTSKCSPSDDRFYTPEMLQVLSSDDLYCILGVSRSPTVDRVTIRRAYLSRSRACHPEYVPRHL